MSRPCLFIDGEAGTTGLGIRDRLWGEQSFDLLQIDPALRKDRKARMAMMQQANLVVLCLPDDAAREAVAMADELGEDGPKILDASTAYRVDPAWVYGFPEMDRDQAEKIASARRVSNPGCYPTGAIGLLRPLQQAGMLPADFPVTVNAVSGYSGGGRAMIEGHERDGGPAFELYGLGLSHKHVPEIQTYCGLARRPLFVPSVGHFRQGMLVSVPLHLDMLEGAPSGEEIRQVLADAYAGSEYVEVAPVGCSALTADVAAGSDKMVLFVCSNDDHRQAVLVARLDNLGKGASGAAVQNIRLMLGLQ